MSNDAMVVRLYDDRRMTFSAWSIGNSKIGSGPGVYTYSRLPGKALGTCPGSTHWCEANCYAKRVDGAVAGVWANNSNTDVIREPLPEDARLVRIHVSGDFDSAAYVGSWIDLAHARPEVSFFGYTRSWRTRLLPMLTKLRDLHNVQLFASVDPGDEPIFLSRLTQTGWRLSLIDEHTETSIMCPEQTGKKESCDDCGFCWRGQRGDVVFRAH